MKRYYIFLLTFLVWGIVGAEDDNSFYFTDAAVKPGETTNIELCMRNAETDLTCLEAEIRLPEGLSVVCDEEGNPVLTLYCNRTVGHEVLANLLEGGNLKLLVSSIDGNLFEGEEGPLLSFCVQAAEKAPTGECIVETVGESLLVNSQAEAYYSTGVKGNVLVTDDATSIKEKDNCGFVELSNSHIYDLSGRKVVNRKVSNGKLGSGIFIQRGRKELHK